LALTKSRLEPFLTSGFPKEVFSREDRWLSVMLVQKENIRQIATLARTGVNSKAEGCGRQPCEYAENTD